MAVTVDKITNELTFFVNEAYGLAEALENEQVKSGGKKRDTFSTSYLLKYPS